MPLFIFLGLLLTLLVRAKPISGGAEPNGIIAQSIQNGNLTYDDSPIGPHFLETTMYQSRVSVNKENCLHVEIGSVAKQALTADWNSYLSEPRVEYTGPPGVRLVADSLNGPPFQQRIVVWTILRIIDHIIQTNNYKATVAQVFWRGGMLGAVSIQIMPPGLSSTSNETIRLPEILAEIASTEVGADALSFESVRYEGPPLPMEEVFRSGIAAINTIAQQYRREGKIYEFQEKWPNTPNAVWHDWWTQHRPSRFHKNALLVSILQATNYAMDRNDYRALKGIVKNHGQYIGEGGYSRHTALDEGSGVATS